MRQKTKIILVVALLLFAGCGQKSEEGPVGKAYTFTAEIPEENADLEFNWSLLEQPDASLLAPQDFIYSADQTTMTFVPDVEGEFTFQVSVSQYGDEISTQTFDFVAIRPSEEEITAADTADLTAWVEEEDERQWFQEETTAVGTTVVETMKTAEEALVEEETETAPPMETIVEQETPEPQATTPPKVIKPQVTTKPKSRVVIPFDKNRFTIQIVSKKKLADAEAVAASLIEAGYDAYIQRVYFKDVDEIWYRVRIGSYDDLEMAKAVAESIATTQHANTWVDFVRYEEH
ncbi:MAG: SPOR domain-containing protein [Fidelibacterota bacterium]